MAGGDYSAYVGRSRRAHDTIEPWRVEGARSGARSPRRYLARRAAAAAFPLPPVSRNDAAVGNGAGRSCRTRRLPATNSTAAPHVCWRSHGPARAAVDRRGSRAGRAQSMPSTRRQVPAGVLSSPAWRTNTGQKGELCLSEERDLIYLEDRGPAPGPGRIEPVAEAAWQRDWDIDPVLLFRYSALTFNSHRIHYDQRYAREEEGYPDLVIHGPLLATLLCRLAEEQAGQTIRSFRFRAMRPFFLGWPVRAAGRPGGGAGGDIVNALTPSGETGMQGHFEFA